MNIGYARISTSDQNLALQLDALKAVGSDRVYEETISSRKRERPIWQNVLTLLREGDLLIVYKLDRIARSTRELLDIIDTLRAQGVAIRSLQEPWADTSSASGKMIMTIMAGIAEFERDLIQQRAKDGREAAKRRGIHMGRPKLLTNEQIEFVKLGRKHSRSVKELALDMRVSQDTIYRALNGPSLSINEIRRQQRPAHGMKHVERKLS